jgi:hypothetical protein
LNKLKIQKESIVSTTTDNGSDVKKEANKDFGIWFSCFCRNLNLVLQSLLNGKQKQKTRDVDENDDEYDDVITSSEEESGEEADNELSNGACSSCSSSKEAEQEDLNDEEKKIDFDPNIFNVTRQLLKKVRKVVKKVRNVQFLNEFFMKRSFEISKCEASLILDFHVQWNSVYLMLERLRRFKSIVNEILNNWLE